MKYLTLEQVLEIHQAMIDSFGGLHGVRDKALLESAIAQPSLIIFGMERYATKYDKAAAYLFFIAKNHPFLDGNKRTAIATTFAFLRGNGEILSYDADDVVDFVVRVANSQEDLTSARTYLESLCKGAS